MTKIVVAAVLLFMTSSAFAAERPCRAWRYHHHHRYCAHR
jgi:hypothetical protein